MNYINYRKLYSNGLNNTDYHLMQCLFQKEPECVLGAYPPSSFVKLADMGFIDYKNKLTKRGRKYLIDVSEAGYDDSIGELTNELVELYESVRKPTGTSLNVQDNLVWFISVTGFSNKAVAGSVSDYLAESGQYTKRLDNLIWTPASKAFSVHKNLKDSPLFELMCRKYNLNKEFYMERRDKQTEWLFDLSRLKVPKRGDGLWFTDSKGDEAHINSAKRRLSQIISKKV